MSTWQRLKTLLMEASSSDGRKTTNGCASRSTLWKQVTGNENSSAYNKQQVAPTSRVLRASLVRSPGGVYHAVYRVLRNYGTGTMGYDRFRDLSSVPGIFRCCTRSLILSERCHRLKQPQGSRSGSRRSTVGRSALSRVILTISRGRGRRTRAPSTPLLLI